MFMPAAATFTAKPRTGAYQAIAAIVYSGYSTSYCLFPLMLQNICAAWSIIVHVTVVKRAPGSDL
jgi:hypothetical protein